MMTITPSLVSRLPASRISRTATSLGSDGECRTSKRSCTAVDTLLTFCPPGPDERTKLSDKLGFVDGDGVGDADHDVSLGARGLNPLIPAQAGIQSHDRIVCRWPHWVPAFAGTNGELSAKYFFASTLPSSTAGWSKASTPRDARR